MRSTVSATARAVASKRSRTSSGVTAWSRSHVDAFRVAVDVEAIAAEEADDRLPEAFRRAHREARRRGHRAQHRHAGNGRLLHELEAHASRDKHDALRERQ